MSRTLKYASYLIGLMLFSGCSTFETPLQEKSAAPAQEATQIQLNQPLHFSSPDSADVVLQPGTYRVEPVADSKLRLTSSDTAESTLLNAETRSGTPDVPAPVALGTLFESDAYSLILLQPGGTGLEAYGSTSGVLSRGFGFQRAPVLRADKGVFLPPDSQPQPRPDLVPTCLRHAEQVVAPNFLTLYLIHSGVRNQGTVAAGSSQASYANSTQPVPPLQPGQMHTLVFTFTNVSPPSSSVNVDSANQVVESNEQNNAGQQRC